MKDFKMVLTMSFGLTDFYSLSSILHSKNAENFIIQLYLFLFL